MRRQTQKGEHTGGKVGFGRPTKPHRPGALFKKEKGQESRKPEKEMVGSGDNRQCPKVIDG